jgi:molybdopterin-guanine dinucleotide biosynthesis protein A
MPTISSTKADCAGVLLAGGRSSRMEGGDKSLKPLGGKPLIAHAIATLAPQVDGLVINANGDPARFAELGLPVTADRDADFAGPLAGLLAGMDWARAHRPAARWVATAACDTPFFPADLVASLHAAALNSGADIALAASGGQSHFVFGLWQMKLAGDLAATLAEGRRKVQDWIERHPYIVVEFEPVDLNGVMLDPFFNINTPGDLAVAEALMQKDSA